MPAAAREKGLAACSHRSTIIVAMLQAAALGFAAGVVIELGAPGSVGPFGVILFAAATAAFFWAFLYPGTRWVRDFAAPRLPRGRRWEQFMLQVVRVRRGRVRAGAGLPGAAARRRRSARAFCRLERRQRLAVAAAAHPGHRAVRLVPRLRLVQERAGGRHHRRQYFPAKADAPPAAAPAAGPPRSWLRRAFETCRDATIWLWQPKVQVPEADGAVDGSALWLEYRRGLLGWPRLGRIALWLLVTIGLIVLVSALVGGAQPEIPARGIADRHAVPPHADRRRPAAAVHDGAGGRRDGPDLALHRPDEERPHALPEEDRPALCRRARPRAASPGGGPDRRPPRRSPTPAARAATRCSTTGSTRGSWASTPR